MWGKQASSLPPQHSADDSGHYSALTRWKRGFAARYLRLRRIFCYRLEDKTIHLFLKIFFSSATFLL
jgi:hypothetical protein